MDWTKIASIANRDAWEHDLPRVGWDLHNAVSALATKRPSFWNDPEAIPALLAAAPWWREIVERYDEVEIAFVIRLHRIAAADRRDNVPVPVDRPEER